MGRKIKIKKNSGNAFIPSPLRPIFYSLSEHSGAFDLPYSFSVRLGFWVCMGPLLFIVLQLALLGQNIRPWSLTTMTPLYRCTLSYKSETQTTSLCWLCLLMGGSPWAASANPSLLTAARHFRVVTILQLQNPSPPLLVHLLFQQENWGHCVEMACESFRFLLYKHSYFPPISKQDQFSLLFRQALCLISSPFPRLRPFAIYYQSFVL